MLAPKIFCPPKIFYTKKFGSKKIRQKKFLVQNNVRTKEICPIIKDNKNKGPKKFKNKKNVEYKNEAPKIDSKICCQNPSVIAEILLIWTNVTLKVHIC